MRWVVDNPVNAAGQPTLPDVSATAPLPVFTPQFPDANVGTLYGYDALDRTVLVTQTGILTGSFNPATETFAAATTRTTWTQYDERDRPITRTLNYRPDINGGEPDPQFPDVNVQTVTYYDGAGNVIWQRDALGRWTFTEYDALNRPVTVTLNYENGDPLTTDPANVGSGDTTDTDIVSVTEYDEAGRVARSIENYVAPGIFDPTAPLTNRVHVQTYDSFGRVITSMINLAPGSTGSAVNISSGTRYDNATGRVVAAQDALGRWTVPQYDTFGRVTHSILNCRDAQGRPTWADCVRPADRTDRSVPTSISQIDALGRTELVTDVVGLVTKTEYDGLGRVLTRTLNYVPGAPTSAITNVQQRTVYADGQGRVVTQIDALGYSSSSATDNLMRTVVMTDAAGIRTEQGYDGSGQLRWTRAPDGTYTVTEIDGLGRTIATIQNYQNGIHTSADGSDKDVITRTSYDQGGRRQATTTADGRATRFSYDLRNQLIQVEENALESGCTAGSTDCNVRTQYVYDRMGNRTAIIDAKGNTRTFAYDAADRQIIARDALGVETHWTYDVLGRVLHEDDPRGEAYDRWHAYDELDHITRTATISSTTLQPITWEYDILGRRTAMHDGTGTTSYRYDPLSRVTEVAHPTGTVGYGYNARSDRTSLIYPDASAVQYAYTPNRLLDTVTRQATVLADYTYDPTTGLLESVAQPHGIETTYQYDGLHRVDQIAHTQADTVVQQFDYSFNHAGQIEAVTTTQQTEGATSNPPTFTYEVINDSSNINFAPTFGHTGDINGDSYTDKITVSSSNVNMQLGTELGGFKKASTVYTASSDTYIQQAHVADINGDGYDDISIILIEHDFYDYATIDSISIKYGSSTGLQGGSFYSTIEYDLEQYETQSSIVDINQDGALDIIVRSYWDRVIVWLNDGSGTLSSSIVTTSGTPVDESYILLMGDVNSDTYPDILMIHPNDDPYDVPLHAWVQNTTTALTAEQTTYTYDDLGRLTAADEPTTTYTYTYDLVGNRTAAGVTTGGSFTHQEYNFNAANQVVGWDYDAAGNLIDDNAHTYTFDARGRMMSAGSATYAYNGDGVLAQATQNGATTSYVQDTQAGLSQILAMTTNGSTTTAFYGHQRLATLTNGAYTWQFHDRLGSVGNPLGRELDHSGAATARPTYDPWGEPTSPLASAFGFTGELQNTDTGLINLRARWYQPGSGTLLGRDPFSGYPDMPYSLHPYQYAYSQPTLFTDPSGLCVSYDNGVIDPRCDQGDLDKAARDQKTYKDVLNDLYIICTNWSFPGSTITVIYRENSVRDFEAARIMLPDLAEEIEAYSLYSVSYYHETGVNGSLELGVKGFGIMVGGDTRNIEEKLTDALAWNLGRKFSASIGQTVVGITDLANQGDITSVTMKLYEYFVEDGNSRARYLQYTYVFCRRNGTCSPHGGKLIGYPLLSSDPIKLIALVASGLNENTVINKQLDEIADDRTMDNFSSLFQ